MSKCDRFGTLSITSCTIKGPEACCSFNPDPSHSCIAPDSTCNVDIVQKALD